MLIKKIQHLAAYYELYEFVADTQNTQAQIKMYLINEADVPESTARRNIKGFVEDEVSMVTVDTEGVVTIKKEEIEALLKMLSELFEVNLPYQKEFVASDEKSKELVSQIESLEMDIENALAYTPEGHLRIRNDNGKQRYYHITNTNDTQGKYIRKKNVELAYQLAQKDYMQKLCNEVRQEIGDIDKFLSKYTENTIENVYNNLNDYRKKLFIMNIWDF